MTARSPLALSLKAYSKKVHSYKSTDRMVHKITYHQDMLKWLEPFERSPMWYRVHEYHEQRLEDTVTDLVTRD